MKRFFTYIFLLGLSLNAFSQVNSINGTVNDYYEVTAIDDAYVDLASAPSLQPGDKVILMQMTGVQTAGSFPTQNLTGVLLQDVGRYGLLAVNNVSGNRVYFTTEIDAGEYTVDEKVQLIKIYEADYATVTGDNLTAQPWNGTTGGVIALVIFKKLTLNADIDAGGYGFRGGLIEPGYTGGCRTFGTDTFYFHNTVTGVAGSKGGGIMEVDITTNYEYTKGPGIFVTGGGGGLGWFAGGGGGSHWGQGGSGGFQKQTTPCNVNHPAVGGEPFFGIYDHTDRVIMGGGGGSSTQDGTYDATNGGSGGGIIIIMTDTLESNNQSIMNDGESVTGMATAGGGAGGAGGAILIDAMVYSGNLTLDVRGGDGGSTGSEKTGAGGGGGGGVIFHSGSTLPGNVSTDVSEGVGGNAEEPQNLGNDGDPGSVKSDMQLPLNGFLFNTINGPDTICEGQVPNELIGSMPRSQSTSYIYEWRQSTDQINWGPAVGTGDLLSFQPPALYDTTYYMRVVLDTLTAESNTPPEKYVYDTSFVVEILVYPALTGNVLSNRDTLCNGQSPGILTGTAMGGGDGTYVYDWQSSTDGSEWTAGRSDQTTLDEDNLTETTYYRRYVTSHGVCESMSNVDTITVLPLITNNIFSPIKDTAICENSDAGVVLATPASELGGGDGSYTFKWTESTDDIVYNTIPGEVGENYSPGVLMDDMYYKRVVYSGLDTVCKSITDTAYYIEVYDLISQNAIVGADIQYVCHDEEKALPGSEPIGGNGTYNYNWEEWVDGSGWDDATGENINRDFTSPALTDTISYRRIALSGDYDQCQDTSEAVLIRINVLPTGDIDSDTAAFCEQGELTINYSNLTGNGRWRITVGDATPLETTDYLTESSGSFIVDVSETASIMALAIEDDSSCFAMDSNFTNIVELTIYERPVPNAGSSNEFCGLTGNLAAQPSRGIGLWTGDDVQFDDPTNPNSGVTATIYDSYSVQWKETNGECADSINTDITFFEQPLETNAGEDQVLDYQFTTTLDAEPADVGEGTWRFETGSGEFEDSTLYNTQVDFSEVGTYELSWTIRNSDACESVSSSVQILIGELEIYNGFSPNGDGVNDEFILKMSGRTTSKLIILDRWGGKVFEVEGTDQLIWNGENMNGNAVLVGTYYYIIKEEGVPDRQGYIELRR